MSRISTFICLIIVPSTKAIVGASMKNYFLHSNGSGILDQKSLKNVTRKEKNWEIFQDRNFFQLFLQSLKCIF